MAGLEALVGSLNEFLDRFMGAVNHTLDNFQHSYSLSNGYGLNKMSVSITPDGIVTRQSSGESVKDIEDRLGRLPPAYKHDAKEKFILGAKIDSIYRDFINSDEGREFIKYLRNNGNGTPRTGTVDDFFVVNEGENLVAATVPDAIRKYIIINQDSIERYAEMLSYSTGLSREDAIKGILAHELHHLYGQTRSERSGLEHKVEYHNDISLVRFYTGLAMKDPANSDLYLAKAKLFTVRYDGDYRESMDDVIADAHERISRFYDNNKDYKQAA